MQKLVQLGSWKISIKDKSIEATEEARRIYGLDDKKLTLKLIQSVPLPKYRKALDLEIHNLIAGISPYDIEFEIKRANDGEIRIIHSMAEYDTVEQSVTGTFQDVTKRKNAENKVEALLQEKNLILHEVHHRIKNNMSSIESLLRLQIENSGVTEVRAELRDAVSRLSSMRVLYDKLYQSEDFIETSSLAYFTKLIDEIAEVFPENVHLTIEKQLDDFMIPSEVTFALGIIINELLTNSLKYAFSAESKKNIIKISANKTGKSVKIIVSDNGAGYSNPEDMVHSCGFGIKLIRMMSEQLGGSAEFSNNGGAVCSIRFKV